MPLVTHANRPSDPRHALRAATPALRDSRATRATQTCTSCATGSPVLNIGRLAPGGEGYYLDTVAAGVEDYYTGAGEAPGHWLTETAASLGLRGRVDPDDLRAVLGARDPSNPEDALVSGRGGRKVPGFDLAFRAPKSVSLIWALGDEATAAVIRDAHDQAVRAAIGYLERHAARSRRGAQGHENIAVSGLVAAAFRHRTSRAGDPLLHTHVLVSNLGCGDGQWRTLDARPLYSHAKTAGYLYQAALREHLSRRLGVQWTAVSNGTAEIAGVPRDVITAFSRRRAQILAEMAERGTHSAKGAQAATLETRQAKDDPAEPSDLRRTWAARAEDLGFGAIQVAALLGTATWQPPDLTAIAHDLAGAAGLTAKASTFTRRDVIQAWCQRLPAGAGVDEIEQFVDAVLRPDAGIAVQLLPSASTPTAFADPAVGAVVSALAERVDVIAAAELRTSADLANSVTSLLAAGWPADKIVSRLLERELDSAEAADAVLAWRAQRLAGAHGVLRSSGVETGAVIRRGDGRVIRADATEPRYSTPELLALERRLVDRAVEGSNAGIAVVDSTVVEAALQRRPSVSDEQAAMIRRLTASGAGVDVVVGKAGAGKTFALDAAREAWQKAGIRVIGAALAARAAAELNAGAGIDSYTIDAVLADLDRGPSGTGIAKGSVVVVDEAAMVGTRKLARLLDHANRASAKVVLVGDHRQLPEIDAGGVFRGLLHRIDAIHLDENRRQRQPWERAALDELRTGAPSAAIAAYADAGGLTVGATADEVRESLVADWWEAYAEHDREAGVMIAARVSDVEDLNDRARRRLTAAGQLTGPSLHAAEREYRQGDRIVTLHNDRRLGVFNGTRATVRSVDVEQAELLVTTDDGVDIRLTAEYLDAGHVAHAYAITGHKAQGLTADRAWVLGSDEIYREWGYVALSRGREHNRLYVVAGDRQPDGDAHCHAGHDTTRDVVADLARALERSRGQALAIDQTCTAGDATTPPPDREQLRTLLQAAPSDPQRERQWIADERDTALDQLSAAERRLEAASERSRAMTGRLRRRTQRHDPQTALADEQRAVADVARWRSRLDDIEQRSLAVNDAQDARDRWLSDHATDVEVAADLIADDARLDWRSVQVAEFRPPGYVLAAIGPRPTDPTERRAWRTAVEHIERYRLGHGIDDAADALGQRPSQARQLADYERASAAIRAVETAREQVTTHLDRSDSTVEQELA